MDLRSKDSLRVWGEIEFIQDSLSLSDQYLSQLMGLKREDYKNLQSKKLSPNLNAIHSLCDNLNLSLISLLNRNYDHQALKQQFRGENHMPARYSEMANGNISTFRGILNYISGVHGPELVRSLLRYLQIKKQSLEDNETQANIRLYEDITNILKTKGYRESHFYEIGCHAINENLKRLGGHIELMYPDLPRHERAIHIFLALMDSNHNYQIERMRNNECFISSKPRPLLMEYFRRKKIGNLFTDQIKAGALSTIPLFAGLEHIYSVEQLKSIHQGDSQTRYRVLFQ